MVKYIYFMICVLDEVKLVVFYDWVFGLMVVEWLDFESFILIYLLNGESLMEFELMVNKDWIEFYDLGDGYGYVVFFVNDVDVLYVWLEVEGFVLCKLVDFVLGGEVIVCFFFIVDLDGY